MSFQIVEKPEQDVHVQEEDPEAARSRVPRSRSYWQAQEASRRSR